MPPSGSSLPDMPPSRSQSRHSAKALLAAHTGRGAHDASQGLERLIDLNRLAALADLPRGTPLQASQVRLAPRRPSSDQNLLMALGLNRDFLQEQDFELDQRLRQLPSGPFLFLHQESMLQHVLEQQKRLYNAQSLIAGHSLLVMPDRKAEPVRPPAGQPDLALLTNLLVQALSTALPLLDAEANLFAAHQLAPQAGRKINLNTALDELACRTLARLIVPAAPPDAVQALIKATDTAPTLGILNQLARLPLQSKLHQHAQTLQTRLQHRLLTRRLATLMKTLRLPDIAESLTGLNGQDLLLHLMRTQKQTKMSDLTVVAYLHGLFAELRQQLRSTLIWTVSLLAHQPAYRHICEMEADILAQAQAPISTLLDHALFTKAAVLESLRLYPPVPVKVWKLSQDDKIGRISIKAGSHVAVSPYVLHRHKDFWLDADLFDPSRFLTPAGKKSKPHAFMPFATPFQTCVHHDLIVPLATLMILALSHHIRLTPTAERSLPPPLLCAQTVPAQPVLMTISPRLSSHD